MALRVMTLVDATRLLAPWAMRVRSDPDNNEEVNMHNSERPLDRRRTRLSRVSWLLPLGLLGCGDFDPARDDLGAVETKTSALTSYAQKALLIRDLTVVRDAARTSDPCNSVAGDENKVWTIGRMLKQEAQRQGKTPQQYVSGWLDAWATAGPTINGQFLTTDELAGPSVRSSWAKDGQGNYLLHKAPLKLLAIVSRLDLRMIRPLGEPLGGEVRFVFAPMLSSWAPTPADGRCMTAADDLSTIILEYSPVRKDENAVVDWAKKWHALGSLPMGSTYRTELAKLTEEVIINGRLLRIRTNEGPLGRWKLTEFEHDGTTKLLRRSTIKQSPTEALHTQNSTTLGNWIKDSRERLRSLEGRPRTHPSSPVANYMMPDTFAGTWLRGSFNDNPGSAELGFWNATNPGIWQGEWDEARHLFSMATCSGCHGKETGTGFLHIQNDDSGAASLSPFLSGPHSVADPVTGTVRRFDEMARREEDLNWLVTDGWVGVPVVRNSYTGGKNAAMNYKLVFMHSAKCMDVAGNSQNEGAPVQQYTCHGRGNQRVALVDHGQSVYSFVFKHSGKCLEVQNASTTNGARLVQRTCTSAQNQKLAMWFSASQTGRYFKFLHSEMCIQVQNANTGNSAPVVQATCPEGDDHLSAKFVE